MAPNRSKNRSKNPHKKWSSFWSSQDRFSNDFGPQTEFQTSNFELWKLEVGSLKLGLPTSDFQLRTLEVRSWKSEVEPSNFRLPTSNFGSSKSGSAPRQQMAVRANGFAAPAIKRCTSDARRLGESTVLVQKCRKPIWISYLFYENLRVQDPAGQKIAKGLIFAYSKVSVSLESGVHFMKSVKIENQKWARRRGESATTKQPILRRTLLPGEN